MYVGKHKFSVKVKWSRYRPGVAQRVGRGIALLFHDRGTRMGWVVSSMSRPHFTPGKYSVPILQEAGWAPGPVWTGGKSRPHWDSIPGRPARSQSLYQLSYPAHINLVYVTNVKSQTLTLALLVHLVFRVVVDAMALLCIADSDVIWAYNLTRRILEDMDLH